MRKFLIILVIGLSISNSLMSQDTVARWIDTEKYDTVECKIWMETQMTVSVPDTIMTRIDVQMGIVYTGYAELKQQKWFNGCDLTNRKRWTKTERFFYHNKRDQIDNQRIWMHRLLVNKEDDE